MGDFTCGTEYNKVYLRVDFRNKKGIFSGTPDMIVEYDEDSDLAAIYQEII